MPQRNRGSETARKPRRARRTSSRAGSPQFAAAPSPAITEDSTILAPARASKQQAKAFIVRRGSTRYNEVDIETIVGHYWRIATPVGIDPVVALAQCVLETSQNGHPISSWWSGRPRRNPAGIGVTGNTRITNPNDTHNWARDDESPTPKWKAGLSFSSWDEGVKAHLGRLLAYVLPSGQGTTAQKELIAFALEQRPLGASLRGSAQTLKPLGAAHNPTGTGWATPGTQYGAKVASIVRAIALTEV